jgi:hypothetical protein
MPRRQAIYAADWAAAEKSGMRVLPEGGAEPAVKNLLANPALLELDDDGNLERWGELIGPTTPTGWHIYDKWNSQNGRIASLPLSQTSYARDTTSASGIIYLQSSTAPSDAPTLSSAPSVSALTASTTLGLAAGWVGIALHWITDSEANGGLISKPSVRDAVQLTSGQRPSVSDLPTFSEAPPEAYGLVISATTVQSSEANALNATTALYVQQVHPVSALPTSATISGPLRTDHAATLEAGPDPTSIDFSYLPDTPVASVSADAVPTLTGNHKIRVAWAFEGGLESAASPQASVTLDSTQTCTVTKPSLSTGSCTLLLNPVDRPAALTGIDHNQIQYVAPTGTPQDYRICSNAPIAVVKEFLNYTGSFYFKGTSFSDCSLFEIIFRDANGEQITDPEPIAELAAGTVAWTRYSHTYTAPAGAVFMEVYGHQVGSGTLLIAAPQIEQGSSVTSYDDGTIASGFSGYIIPAWETMPIEYEHYLGPLTTGFSGATIEIDDSDGYDYTVGYASSDDSPEDVSPSTWSGYTSSITSLTRRDYLAAKIEVEKP